jgi:hypothetical protein
MILLNYLLPLLPAAYASLCVRKLPANLLVLFGSVWNLYFLFANWGRFNEAWAMKGLAVLQAFYIAMGFAAAGVALLISLFRFLRRWGTYRISP